MSELLVTQCPYCQTRFRLSQQHLEAAAGNVRCGACLKVFNASLAPPPASDPDSAVGTGAAETSGPATPETIAASPTPPPQAPRQGTLLIHDDLDFDELDLEALGLDESLIDEVNPRENSQANLPPGIDEDQLQAEAEQAATIPVRDMDAEFDLDLEADAAGIIEPLGSDPLLDLHDDFIASPVQDFGPPTNAEPDETPEAHPQEPPQGFGLPRAGSPLRPLVADPGQANHGILLRDKPEYVTPKLAWHEPSEDPVEAPGATTETDTASRPGVARLFKPITAPEPEPEPEPEPGELDIPELREDLALFEEEPLTYPRRKPLNWLWGTLSVVAALALLGQFVNYNFNALAHDQRTRPLLESACLLAGCQLPPRVDIGLLRSSNLVVRSHPEFPNALAVDVILYNRADFSQPFPVLRMSFSDSHGREIANRQFRPEEYLSGELAGARLMPNQVPIHVALSMIDPGEEAVSYSLHFLSP